MGGSECASALQADDQEDINMQGGWYSSALLAASPRGHENSVWFLLQVAKETDREGMAVHCFRRQRLPSWKLIATRGFFDQAVVYPIK